ncbi:MAG: YgjV family protein, partial [Clostridia bacterium]|nr:YgjV family protein [Clostridia bacterium]
LFILDAPTGCVLNLVGICRAIVFSNKKFFRADRKIWIAVFSLASAGVYALTFLVFGKDPTPVNLIIEFLPVIGMIATTVGFYRDGAKDVRLLSLINSPCWLVYHLTSKSIGGIAGEVVMLISIVVGYLRHDRKKPAADGGEIEGKNVCEEAAENADEIKSGR